MTEYPYHLNVKIMSRSKNHNAVAAAAYRSGQKLRADPNPPSVKVAFNEQDPDDQTLSPKTYKMSYDYRRRAGVMSSFIAAPKDAPAWTRDRGLLWNAVEASEKRKDAQLAREVVVSLPDVDIFNHLTPENKAERLREFYERILKTYVNESFVKEGMVADVALHTPSEKNDERHFHAHIMLTMREITAEGFGAKNRTWNEPKVLESWRENWAHVVNDALKRHKIDGFIDHRTNEARGLDIGVTKPLGKDDHKRERFGIATKAGNDNRKVREENRAGHKYLEKLFEHSPVAPLHEIIASITREGFANPQEMVETLEEEGVLIPLYSKETGFKSGMYNFAPMKMRADKIRAQGKRLHERNDFALSPELVQNTLKARGDKMVREALAYTADAKGFKVIESDNNGHKKTYLKSCHDLYKASGYDVISVARNNQGKDVFKAAGINKSVITYRDLLRRFGDRYTGAKSTSKKVIIIDEADQLSPQQDQEIMNTANKIGAKLIYIGSPKAKGRRLWQSLFGAYKLLTAAKSLRHKFLKTDNVKNDLIRGAFMNARTHDALQMQKAKYLHAHHGSVQTKQAVLDRWLKEAKKDDKRFILCSSEVDTLHFNTEIQKSRLKRKHLKAHTAKHFTARYKTQNNKEISREMALHWGDMIQFKKGYHDIGIEKDTRARVLIHYADTSLIETDDGRLMKIDLKAHNGFDLGYAGVNTSSSDHMLDQGYIYHSKANAMDDAPLLYQNSKNPVHVFYDEDQVADLQDLASQMLGRRHYMNDGFAAVSGFNEGNDNDILTSSDDNANEDEGHETNRLA